MTSADVEVTGYRLALPSGWERVTTGEGSEATIKRLVRSAVADLPERERVIHGDKLTKQLKKQVNEAQDKGVVDIYSYAHELHGVPVAMGFSVSVAFFGIGLDDEALSVIAGIDTGAEVMKLDLPGGGIAVRAVRCDQLSPEQLRDRFKTVILEEPGHEDEEQAALSAWHEAGVPYAEVVVSYLIPIPGDDGSFLTFVFSIQDGPLAEAEIYHFDTVVSTLHWVLAEDA
jgi:hypothetical protein